MDIIEHAQEREQRDRDDSILIATKANKPLPFVGQCYNCLEALAFGNFCDCDCRNDYEHRKHCESLNK